MHTPWSDLQARQWHPPQWAASSHVNQQPLTDTPTALPNVDNSSLRLSSQVTLCCVKLAAETKWHNLAHVYGKLVQGSYESQSALGLN